MRNRLTPAFGKMRLDAIDHSRVSAWFDAASADRPGAANRAFEALRAMLTAARQWGALGEHVPGACANIVKNPRMPVARHLDRDELERLGAALDRHCEQHPWPVSAIRLLTLTGARLSEVLNRRWDEIGDLTEDGASARLEDSKTGPRTVPARAGSGTTGRGAAPIRRRSASVSPRTSRPNGSAPSGATSGRKPGCPAFTSTTAGTPGPRRAS